MLREEPGPFYGNDRYEGFCVDVIDEISKIIGFNYTLRSVEDEEELVDGGRCC